jgi:anthranilate synthase component 1
MHLVSSLEGKLKPELEAIDAFRACFPAGTLSGAPKIRAMEIIEELEPARRGVYGGSISVCGFQWQFRFVHRHPHALHERRAGIHPGRRLASSPTPSQRTEFAEC